jgi:hypothetical protein
VATKLRGLVIAATGAILFILAPFADRVLGELLPGDLCKHVSALPLVFGACDLAFVGLFVYLSDNRESKEKDR